MSQEKANELIERMKTLLITEESEVAVSLVLGLINQLLALLAKPKCKTCGGLKIVCKDDIGLAFGGVAASCPRCTGIEPEPEPTETSEAIVEEFIKDLQWSLRDSYNSSSCLNSKQREFLKEKLQVLLDSQQAELGQQKAVLEQARNHIKYGQDTSEVVISNIGKVLKESK